MALTDECNMYQNSIYIFIQAGERGLDSPGCIGESMMLSYPGQPPGR